MTKEKKLAKNTALKLQNKMFQGSKGIQKYIKKFNDKKGYETLGFSSLKEWSLANENKLSVSYDTLNNHLHAARISLLMKVAPGTFFTYSILPMKNLSNRDIKKIIKQAKKYHDVDELTDEHFSTSLTKKFMKKIGIKETTDNSKKSKQKHDEIVSSCDKERYESNESDDEDDFSLNEEHEERNDLAFSEDNFELTALKIRLIEEISSFNKSSETRQLGKAIIKVFCMKQQLKLCITIFKANRNNELDDATKELNDIIKKL